MVQTQSTGNLAFGSAWSPTLPSGVQVGDFLLVVFFLQGAFTDPSVNAGWTLVDTEIGVSGPSIVIAAKVATGTDSFNLTTNAATSNWASFVAFRITNASLANLEYIYSSDGTTTNTVSFATLTPTGGLAERLWLAVFGWLGDSAATVSSFPSGYGSTQQSAPTGATNRPAGASARLTATDSAQSPGNATLSANRTSYRSLTISLEP